MIEAAEILMALGSVLLLGVVTDSLGRRTALPRVTLLLIFGFLIGPGALDLLPAPFVSLFNLIADMTLLMVGFLLGGQFTIAAMRKHGKEVLCISIFAVLITAAAVFVAVLPLGVGLPMALLLAGIAPATAPAAIFDVVHEAKADGPFTQKLLGVVAIDDAWGLMLFSFCAAVAASIVGTSEVGSPLVMAAWEIGGAILLGVVFGLPAAYLTGRIEPGEPTLSEALGIVFLCGGLAIWLEVSFLIAAIVVGIVITNLAKHHSRPFHAIRNVEWPFMVIFFVLAGASLELTALRSIGWVAATYVFSRAIGRLVGAWLGGKSCQAEESVGKWMGLALMPQAGVALGMALVASSRMPEFKELLLPVIISSTIIFELTGPIMARYALRRVGEEGQAVESEIE